MKQAKIFSIIFFIVLFFNFLLGYSLAHNGQISGWLVEDGQKGELSQLGIRYIPEFTMEQTFDDTHKLDAEIAFNTFSYTNFYDNKELDDGEDFKPYRQWVRFSANHYELRVGLQKINFGSATLFRPLQWFDRLDPRDPLKLTDGVYGGLYRYYFNNNANIWLWVLYGNKELKGTEQNNTQDRGGEFGFRLQNPFLQGESAITYHHRRADEEFVVDEDRLGFDGKWDYVLGFWFEGVVIHRATELPNMAYKHNWTLGVDYTLGIGNGVGVLAEVNNVAGADELFDTNASRKYTGGTLRYPLGIFDQLAAVYTYDNQTYDDYLQLTWQRTYDDLIFYCIAFANPDQSRLNGEGLFSGNGVQIMATYNY